MSKEKATRVDANIAFIRHYVREKGLTLMIDFKALLGSNPVSLSSLMRHVAYFGFLSQVTLGLPAMATSTEAPANITGGIMQPASTDATTTLGLHLLQKLVEIDNGNVFLSPASLYVALSMVWNGAHGQTQTELSTVLGLSGIDSAQAQRRQERGVFPKLS